MNLERIWQFLLAGGEPRVYAYAYLGMLAAALLTVPALLFVTAPYGRHTSTQYGPTIRSRLGWIIMEAPSPILMVLTFVLGVHKGGVYVVFLLLWLLHYIHRSFVFPFRMRGGDRPMPILIMGSAVVFNLLNGYLNGRYLFTLEAERGWEWLQTPQFGVGVVLFLLGFVINYRADQKLLSLRKPGETGYKIPYGGLYNLVSCPNYLGEILEWCGWALLTWSPPGLLFALWTAANLAPRARANHRFYHERFPDYPRDRRALVPFLY